MVCDDWRYMEHIVGTAAIIMPRVMSLALPNTKVITSNYCI